MRPELERVLGLELTSDVLKCLTHAETLDTAGTGEAEKADRKGRRRSKRYTARATYLPHPVRSEEDLCVRRACAFLLAILERMRPTQSGKGRALSRALWLGRLPGREGRWGMADRIGVSVRQLEHYLAVLSPIVARWQPPANDVGPRYTGRVSGHAYATYELRREMPAKLKRALGGRWVRPREAEGAHDVPSDVARAEREASTRADCETIDGGPRSGPPGAAEAFYHLFPS